MSGLIKAGGSPLAFAVRAVPTQDPVQPEEASRLGQRIAELEQKLAARDAQLAEARTQAQAEAREAYQAGEAAARAEAEDANAARLVLLGRGIEAAQRAYEDFLDRSELLAALLARECLARMLGDIHDMAGTVQRLVRHQIEAIDASALLAITVSALDFDETALDRMREQFGEGGPDVRRREELASGACRFELALGQIDLGLPQQWAAVRSLLGELAGEDASA